MGGSGSGGYIPPGGREEPPEEDCNIYIETKIFGIIPEALDIIEEGNILHVQLNAERNPPSVVLIKEDPSPTQVGAVANHPYLPKLIRCIQQGIDYEAEVTDISGAQVSIAISKA